jgi:hypothetical protein
MTFRLGKLVFQLLWGLFNVKINLEQKLKKRNIHIFFK